MKKLLSILLSALMLLSLISITASALTTADGFTYTVADGKATITGYEGTSTDLIIPSTVDGYPVVAIGDSAFSNRTDFKGKLVIPDSVKTISDYAFTDCSGFRGNLIIPESVLSIGSYAFMGCDGFSGNLVIPEGVTEIAISAFENCSGFTGNLVIPEGVKSIGDFAFLYCSGLTGELVIPKGVATIGKYAFAYCYGLTGELVIPEKVTTIEESAFCHCTSLGGKLVIPEGVTTIRENAFINCFNLTEEVIIPDSMTRISRDAFAGTNITHFIYAGSEEQWNNVIMNDSTIKQYLHLNFNIETDITTKETAPTCGTAGYTTYICSCGYSYKAKYVAPTEEHSWYATNNIYPCLGGTVDYRCEWCGDTKSEYAAPTEEHSYMWDELSDDIQCEGGYANLYCWMCGNDYYVYIEAEGHQYQFVSVNNATCTEDGTKRKECSRCNDIGETVVDVGSKLGHDLTETTVLSQTTCTQDGISVQACKRCAEIVATIEGAYGHFDNDGDGKCDECKVVLEVILPEVPSEPETDVTPEDPESPEEPQESNNILAKIMEFFNKIINILKKLFGI